MLSYPCDIPQIGRFHRNEGCRDNLLQQLQDLVMKRGFGHVSEHGTAPVLLRMACGPDFVLQDAVRHDGDADVSSRKPLAAYGSAEGSGWFERMAGEDFPEFATTTQ